MKVLWVFNHPAPYKVDFFKELAKYVELTVLFERDFESDRSASFYEAKEQGYKSIHLKGMKLGPHNNFTTKIIPYLTDEYDLIVINGWSTFAEMRAIAYLQKKKIPYVFAINGGIIKYDDSSLKDHLKRKFIPGASYYLCPDENSKRYLIHYGAIKEKIRLFPYSTVHEDQRLKEPIKEEERRTYFQKYGIKEPNVYLSIGQIIDRKRPLELLEWFKDSSEDKALVYLGTGKKEIELYSRIKELGIKRVYLLGQLPHQETLNALAHAKSSIFLTKEDIYGHVVNESLSVGTPVIASPFSNSALKLIKNGVNGYILDKKDEFLLALDAVDNEEFRIAALESSKDETLEKMALVHKNLFEEFSK